ncbi:hypothetical protein CDD81_4438 [Ophiocordyceps australis]|uniref:Uncharacterized protein n=1 Tax=Ophiocordyceps australis TaxID=1399860 RepID=A0A2C5YHE9_9HYPO|nr:hypothetical protein CDD81_4438 [Ophiocordyceps australis]
MASRVNWHTPLTGGPSWVGGRELRVSPHVRAQSLDDTCPEKPPASSEHAGARKKKEWTGGWRCKVSNVVPRNKQLAQLPVFPRVRHADQDDAMERSERQVLAGDEARSDVASWCGCAEVESREFPEADEAMWLRIQANLINELADGFAYRE